MPVALNADHEMEKRLRAFREARGAGACPENRCRPHDLPGVGVRSGDIGGALPQNRRNVRDIRL